MGNSVCMSTGMYVTIRARAGCGGSKSRDLTPFSRIFKNKRGSGHGTEKHFSYYDPGVPRQII